MSVIVPTRDRPAHLRECLAALDRQSRDDVELIVVDDGSIDRAGVAAVATPYPRVRLVGGDGRGPAAARNRGAAVASAPRLCFVDDDCAPEPQWLTELDAAFDAGATVVAGPTLAGHVGNPFSVASQVITNHLADWSRWGDGARFGFAPTSNVACLAHVHAAVPFDERYTSAAGEDRAWCRRLAAAGEDMRWVPDARVRHLQDLTLASFIRQQFRYGRGAWRFHRDRGASERHAVGGPRAGLGVGFYAALVRAGFRCRAAVGGLVLAAQAITAAGLATEAISARGAVDRPGR
jgi:GT2 family glycosyltransferase